MKAIVEVLYREVSGAGDDTEANVADGVVISLTKWSALSGSWRVRNHYMIEKTVMINREIVTHSFDVETFGATDSEMIRAAIKMFDELVAGHPVSSEPEQS